MNYQVQIEDRVLETLRAEVREQPHPLLFVTISGAHAYGFPSPDSDFDLRGAHILPLRQIIGLNTPRETLEISRQRQGEHMDLVTHDVGKYFRLLLKHSGYVLEQIVSPLIIVSSPEHEELKAIARRSVAKMHARHYFGFAHNQWKMFERKTPHRVKPLLYIYRVLLSGIHMMKTGEIETNLLVLNDTFQSPQVRELIALKTAESEVTHLPNPDLAFYRAEYERLQNELREAESSTRLPATCDIRDELNDLLLRLRLGE
jgi:predicted nucleotidyltransferase